MEKIKSQIIDSVRLILVATVCILCFVAGAAYTKVDLWMTMRYAPPIKIHPVTPPTANEQKTLKATEKTTPTELASLTPSLPLGKMKTTPAPERSEPSTDEWHTVRMRVTAYCPCPKCCGQYADGITACGHVIQPGDTFVAADKRYAFGTELIVPGYTHGQVVKVLDRGGAIKGDRIDVFFHFHQEALEWGVQYLDVKIHNK
ncbi:MAG: 3D domain-containing protein [Sedimentisphaerales bacterium]|nr:3D domain-containing protein [Sedimentisphaerales bacterium]